MLNVVMQSVIIIILNVVILNIMLNVVIVERLGFCLTGMHTLAQESAAPIYVQTYIVHVISSSLELVLKVD